MNQQESHEVQGKENAKSCTWWHQFMLGATDWKESLQKRRWRSWWTSGPGASDVLSQQRRPTASWDALGRLKEVIFPLSSASEVLVLGSPVQKKQDILEWVQERDIKMIKGLEHFLCEEGLRELGLFSLEKRRLRGILSMYVNTWREGAKGTEPGSFQWCPVAGPEAMGTNWTDRTRDNGHRLKHRRFALNIREHLFTVRVTEHWNRLPREAVESPSLNILKSWWHDRHDSWQLTLGGPAWAGGLDKMTSRRAFQSQPFCDPVIIFLLCTSKMSLAPSSLHSPIM